jgi:hypothetical protein
MLTVDGSKTVRERKVVHDSRPQFIGYLKLLWRRTRQPSDLQQGRRRENEPPDLLQISSSQLERIQQAVYIHGRGVMGCCQRLTKSSYRNRSARFLPASRIPFHSQKDRTQGLDQKRADVRPIRGWEDTGANVHLADAKVVADSNWRE